MLGIKNSCIMTTSFFYWWKFHIITMPFCRIIKLILYSIPLYDTYINKNIAPNMLS